MALSDLSFKVYTDAALTTLLGSLKSYAHRTDLSDNPQDVQLWLGSLNELRRLRRDAGSGTPGTDPIIITPTDNLANWAASTVYTINGLREPTTPNGYRYRVKVSGTSGATEPTWPTSGVGSTVADGTVLWELTGPRHAVTEVKLSLTEGGLASATGGAGLTLGTEILGGDDEAIEFWMRITNAVTVISTGRDINISINAVQEEVYP